MSKREIPQVISDLQAVRDRLAPIEMWRRGSYGKIAGPNCIMGVVYMVTGNARVVTLEGLINRMTPPLNDLRLVSVQQALLTAIRELDSSRDSIVSFNDTTSHEALLSMIDIAIEAEKTKAGVVEYV